MKTNNNNPLRDAILRETQNEILNNVDIYQKTQQPPDIELELCAIDQSRMIKICHQSPYCRNTPLRDSLDEMCVSSIDINVMSVNAFEQFMWILGLIIMCCFLYIALCVIENLIVLLIYGKRNTE